MALYFVHRFAGCDFRKFQVWPIEKNRAQILATAELACEICLRECRGRQQRNGGKE